MKPSGHSGTPRRLLVGLTPDLGLTSGRYPSPRFELKKDYADAVFRAGGLPWILPYVEEPAVIEATLDRLSALVVTGGAFDIPPEAYGDTPREGLGETRPERTAFETLVLREAMKRQMPVLGICGGMQLLNVVLGGSLFQDIRREVEGAREHEQPQERDKPHHPVDVKAGTLLSTLLGKGQVMVNSTHHQAVNRLGVSVRASAVAPDGVVEAIEVSGHPFALGVQWHPEALMNSMPIHLGIFRGLLQKAKEFRR